MTAKYPLVLNGTAIQELQSADSIAGLTTGTGIQKGNGTGGFTTATLGSDYAPATSGISSVQLLAGNGLGGFTAINLGTNLSFSGTTLNSAGGGGSSGVTTFNTRSGAVSLTTADVSGVSGVVTSTSYSDPSWITSLAASKISGSVSDPSWITSLSASKISGTVATAASAGTAGSASTAGSANTATTATKTQGTYGYAGDGTGVNFRVYSSSSYLVLEGNGTLPIVFNMYGGGSVANINSSGVYTTVSDGSIKDNQQALTKGLNAVLSLAPKTYNIRSVTEQLAEMGKPPKSEIGLVAQEVLQVIPEVVSTPEEEGQLYGLNYSALIPVLIKAIQELNAKVEALTPA